MIKSRNPLFNKTINKKIPLTRSSQQCNPNKTRRSYFKLSKNNPNLTNIIQNLEKNVKQLKNYHESLQKTNIHKLHKSNSLSQINKFRCSSKNKIKTYLPATTTRKTNPIRQNMAYKQNQCLNSKDPIIQSTVSKYIPENASTMLSVLNTDVDEVKKAYVQTYGKQNVNIVDLYNFFKKNVQKSTRIHGGSIQISSYAHGQHSEYLKKSREHLPRKSNEFLNVIVEDRQQKQPVLQSSKKTQEESSSIYKISAQKNPTMEEIFKNGCPDLANVYDFVKKRRVSLKNYMNLNKQKEINNQKKNICEKTEIKKLTQPTEIKNQQDSDVKFEQLEKNQSTPLFENTWSNNKKFLIQQSQLSNKKYLPSKSSKKSQKSSIKKSKQKDNNLDENIQTDDINMFNLQPLEVQNQEQQAKKQVNLDFIVENKDQDRKQIELKYEKFKKSKYYVEPVPLQKQNSLDGCSISLKSSSRIIQLDFIPLDL